MRSWKALCNKDCAEDVKHHHDSVLGWWPFYRSIGCLVPCLSQRARLDGQWTPTAYTKTTLQLDPGKSLEIFQFHVVKIRNISLIFQPQYCTSSNGHIWFLEFGHKSNKIILNKKPSNFEHIFLLLTVSQ